jgi:hypothetical protein
MKEPYEEGVAIHLDLQSCASSREAAGEALAEAHAGWVLSSESLRELGADVFPAHGRRDR